LNRDVKEAFSKAVTVLWTGLPKQGDMTIEGVMASWEMALTAKDEKGYAVDPTPRELETAALRLSRKCEWFPTVSKLIAEIYKLRADEWYALKENSDWVELPDGRMSMVPKGSVPALPQPEFTQDELIAARDRFRASAAKLLTKLGDEQ
jgi:hypothetical protein